MAMVIRSPASITAWTSGKISRLEPPRARNPHQQMDQGRPLPSLSRAFWRTALAHYPQQFGRQSRRVSPARHRGLDPALSCLHSLDHAAPKALQASRPHPFPADARPLRFLLRLPALSYLSRARSVLRPRRDVERRRQAAFYHRRLRRFCAADSPGNHFHRWLDSAPWRKALAAASSRDLHHRCLWRDSLLLAGEVRCAQAALLRRARRSSSSLEIGRLAFQTRFRGWPEALAYSGFVVVLFRFRKPSRPNTSPATTIPTPIMTSPNVLSPDGSRPACTTQTESPTVTPFFSNAYFTSPSSPLSATPRTMNVPSASRCMYFRISFSFTPTTSCTGAAAFCSADIGMYR